MGMERREKGERRKKELEGSVGCGGCNGAGVVGDWWRMCTNA